MDFFEVVEERKSIRQFKGEEIEEKKFQKLLHAMNRAPSAGNMQAYKVYAVKNKEIREKLQGTTFNQKSTFIKEAPVVFVFCSNAEKTVERFGERGKTLYSIQDLTIAISYMQLAATALGLGSVWVGAFEHEKVKEALNSSNEPIALLPVGYPNENPDKKQRKSLDELVEIIE